MKEAFAMKRGELSKVLALLWAFICIVYAAPALAQPLTITVTTNADVVNNPWADCTPPGTGDCSLREAITVANWNGASGDVIVFAPSLDGATITLDPALGGLWIGGDRGTTIDATSLATGITIDANNGIAIPLSLNSDNITIQGPITIKRAGAGGAAIVLNPGANVAWLQEVTVTNNAGAGIYLNGVNNVTISNSSISGNDAEGVVVRDSSFVNINNSTISSNGRNGLSSGVFIFGTSNTISLFNNIIEDNEGNGITVIEDFATDQAPTKITIRQNTIRRNGFTAVDGVGIQIAGAVSFVDIGGNEIYENAAQGILVERTPAGSNGPQNINIVPAPWNGALPNYIYSNVQEGILIRDLGTQNNVVRYNWIGVDPSDNPAPNGNSGVSLFGGTTNNTIEANTIRYNQYQDVLISGAGTSNNTVQNNTIWGGADVSPRVGYDNAGVVINDGATNNLVVGNNIAYHVFDGVQVVGPGTDDNVIGGNQVSANGRGVVVINDYSDAVPPDPDAPPFDLQTDSFTAPGPARTQILFNLITQNNNDGILVRRDGGGTVIENNDIINNQADGIRLVGASPSIRSNNITDNAQNGIHALVFFGQDDSHATASDDVLSQPTIQDNFIASNGAWGVLAIDTPLDLSTVDRNNSWPDPFGKPP
jgi:parallel beta-helix repeat protein